MSCRSGHRPTRRLVPRKPVGPIPEENLWDYLPPPDDHVDPNVQPPNDGTIDERFEKWINRNPQVLDLFIQLARDWKAAGQARCGGKMLAEVLRYHSGIRGDEHGYKLNNVYISRLTRLAVQTAPDLDGLFEFRELTSLRSA